MLLLFVLLKISLTEPMRILAREQVQKSVVTHFCERVGWVSWKHLLFIKLTSDDMKPLVELMLLLLLVSTYHG